MSHPLCVYVEFLPARWEEFQRKLAALLTWQHMWVVSGYAYTTMITVITLGLPQWLLLSSTAVAAAFSSTSQRPGAAAGCGGGHG
jgi:hypothetical protein